MQAEIDRVTDLTLGDLPLDDTNHLLADSLQLSVADCRDLSQVLVDRTAGNPFFLRQLLYALEADRLLGFDREQRRWMWDHPLGQSLQARGSVVDLMIRKIRTLPGDTRHALSMAACIGSRFDTLTLHTVIGQPQADILTALNPALQGGLIVQSDGHFSFAHDRIQEAGYALIPKSDRPQIHLESGRSLLASTKAEDLGQEILTVVGHLNVGRASIDTDSEKIELAALNLAAGQKAKAASAFADAKEYIEIGLELLATDSWQDQYELTLSLHNENGELAALTGQFDQVSTTANLIHANAKNILDRVRIYMARIEAETIQYNLSQALQIGLEALKDLGIEIPMHPSAEYYQSLKAGLVDLLSRKRETNWAELPQMSDETALAVSSLLASEMSTSYIANPQLYPIVAYRNAILTLEFGVSPWSPFCFLGVATDAVSLVNHETPVDVAREHFLFAQEMQHIARELMKNPVTAISQTKTLLLLSFISVWTETIEKSVELTQATYRSGYQTGDMLYGSYGAIVFAIESFGAGMDLVAYQSQLSDYVDRLKRMGQILVPQWLTIFLQAAQNFKETISDPHELHGTHFDEDEWLPNALASNDVSGRYFLSICRLLLAYHFDVDDRLDDYIHQAEKLLDGGRSLFSIADFYLYAALSKLRLAEGSGTQDHPGTMDLVNSYLQLVEVWSQFAPSTFQHKYDLIAAEKARVTGDLDSALSGYEKAITGARENGFTQDEALANELYARFWLERGNERFASLFMREAHSLYRKWGALAKAEHLTKRYPNCLIGRSIVVDEPRTQIISDQITGDLDLLTVLKASQDIASEIALDRLLAKLMNNVIENSGAQRGYLILEQDGQWMIAAEGDVDDPEPYHRAAENVANSDLLAQGIVHYVARTQETVVLEDASQSGEFIQDPYVRRHQARSILCAPLINQVKTSGILYLENNLAPRVFSSQRVNLLRLLSSQMAVSLDNARIHDHLEASEARFRATFEQAAVGIAHVAPDGRFLRLNEKFCDIVGYSQDEMLARTFQDITHPDDLDADLEHTRQLLAGETETYDIEKRYFRKSGEIVWVNLTVSLVRQATGEPDYFVTVVEDITRRKQAEQALRESEEQYRILELDPLLELILDHLGQAVDYDDAAIWIREGDNLVIRAGHTPEGTPSLVGKRVTMTASATIREMIETMEPFMVADTAKYKDLVQELKAVLESLGEHYERTGTSWLGVPVVAKNQVIGIICLVSEQPGYYTRSMADSVQTLVNRAAIAIENARLHQQVRQSAALEERARVARELHDSVSQTLFSASMLADTTPLAWDIDQAMARKNLNQLGQLLRGASAEMRTLLFELRPDAMQNQTLGQLLDPLAEAARARTRAMVSLNVEGDRILPENVTIALLRIAQESLNNVAKHAEATEVNVDLACGPEGVVLRIRDDGRGFDPADIPPGHFGIGNMTDRARKIGATFKVESNPGGGTQVLVTWSEGGEENGNA
jgi:PAS domain S-box-containing protein